MTDINHLGPRYPPNRLSRANLFTYDEQSETFALDSAG